MKKIQMERNAYKEIKHKIFSGSSWDCAEKCRVLFLEMQEMLSFEKIWAIFLKY